MSPLDRASALLQRAQAIATPREAAVIEQLRGELNACKEGSPGKLEDIHAYIESSQGSMPAGMPRCLKAFADEIARHKTQFRQVVRAEMEPFLISALADLVVDYAIDHNDLKPFHRALEEFRSYAEIHHSDLLDVVHQLRNASQKYDAQGPVVFEEPANKLTKLIAQKIGFANSEMLGALNYGLQVEIAKLGGPDFFGYHSDL